MDIIDKKFKGWDRKGIQLFNFLVHAIKNNRECPESKETDIELKLTYNKLCRRLNDNNIGSDSSGNEDSDSEDLELYDSFASGFQSSHAMNQTPV